MKREEKGFEACVEMAGFIAFGLDADSETENSIRHSQAARHGVAELFFGTQGVVEGFVEELGEGGREGREGMVSKTTERHKTRGEGRREGGVSYLLQHLHHHPILDVILP